MLVCRVSSVLFILLTVRAQNPPAPARNPRTIQAFLTSVGDLFGYDVFRRPRIVINIPAALPAGPPAAPAPAPAPAPARPGPPMPPPPAPPAAPAPAPAPPAPAVIAAPNLLTDSVRRQFSVNLNWDRNRSPENEPIISAVYPPGVSLPAPATPAAAVVPAPVPEAPQAPPRQRLPDYEEQVDREDYDDRPKRFHIDIPDYQNLEELSESKRETNVKDNDQSKVRFKEDFQNYWQNAPWKVERGYKYIIPQGSSNSPTLLNVNKPNEIPKELSKYEEISLPKEKKVRSLNSALRDPLTAAATAETFYQQPPEDLSFFGQQLAEPSYLTSKVVNAELLNYFKLKEQPNANLFRQQPLEPSVEPSVNAELLKFYNHKFKNDANVKQHQANTAQSVNDNADVQNLYQNEPAADQNSYQNAPAGDYQNPALNLYALPENFDKDGPVQQIIIEQEQPLDFYANPHQPFRIEVEDVNKSEDAEVEKEEIEAEKVPANEETLKEEEKENLKEEDSDTKIIGSNEKENFEVEHLEDVLNTNENESKLKEQVVNKEEEPKNSLDTEDKEQDYKYAYQDIDSFIKAHFGDQKHKDFDQIREEIESEGELRANKNKEIEEALEQESEQAQKQELEQETQQEQKKEDEKEAEQGNQQEQKKEDEKEAEQGNQQEQKKEEQEQEKENEEEQEREEEKDEVSEGEHTSEVEIPKANEDISNTKDAEEEESKVKELEREHEQSFHVGFPKLGEGTEYEDFFKAFNDDHEAKPTNELNKNKDNDGHEAKPTNEQIKINKDKDVKKESSEKVKTYSKDVKKPSKKKKASKNKDPIKDFDIHDSYKKAKESFSKVLNANGKRKLPERKPKKNEKVEHKKNEKLEPKKQESVVHPLYSGVWHIGNLQEVYKQDRPVTIPFDHDYSASERSPKIKNRSKRYAKENSKNDEIQINLDKYVVDGSEIINLKTLEKPRSRRETEYYLNNDPEEIQINPNEYVEDGSEVVKQLEEYKDDYVPESYSEEYTYEAPDPKPLDLKQLEKKQYVEDDKLSKNAKIITKQIGKKSSFISVDKPQTKIF